MEKEQRKSQIERAKLNVQDKAHQAKEKLAETGKDLKKDYHDQPQHEQHQSVGESIKEKVQHGVESVKSSAQAAKEKLQETFGSGESHQH